MRRGSFRRLIGLMRRVVNDMPVRSPLIAVKSNFLKIMLKNSLIMLIY